MIETTRAERWLYEMLAGDPALAALVADRIYAQQTPQDLIVPASCSISRPPRT